MSILHPRAAVAALRLVPKHTLSRLAGHAAALRLPGPLQRLQIKAFGRAVGVDFDEARDPIESFRSLQDFFTRALRDGVRPIDPAADVVVSPCDGCWGASGTVEADTLLQVKGSPYSLTALLGSSVLAQVFKGGCYATLYLSPRDYHRFHMPCAARVRSASYIPGALWPVNRIGVEGVEGLFTQNERICAFMSVAGDPVDLALVAVAATMVGKVHVTFDDLTTNVRGGHQVLRSYREPRRFAKGEEWGRFEFGSTIVMVAAPALMQLETQLSGTGVRLGQRIGRLLTLPSSR